MSELALKTPAKRGNPNWVKGVSGNPAGPPKNLHGLQELARAHCPDVIERLAEIVKDRKSPPAAACIAGGILLDRGYGKAVQIVAEVSTNLSDAIDITDADLAAIARSSSANLAITQAREKESGIVH